MYNHHNLLTNKIASKSSIKPELSCIAFYGNRTVATDSFRLLEVSATGKKHEPKLLPARDIKANTIPKALVKFDLDVIEGVTNQTANSDWQFPEIDGLMKEDPNVEYATVRVNGQLLGELLTQMSKMNKFKAVDIKIPIGENHKPIHLYSNDGNKNEEERQTAHGLFMGMNR